MDYLQHDTGMLVSSVNMLLRDGEYDSLEEICNVFGRDMEEILKQLNDAGYVYSYDQRQIRPIGFDE